jgi:hypothetical protein
MSLPILAESATTHPRAAAQQLRQFGDVGGDAPGLVAREQLRRVSSDLLSDCLRTTKEC